MSLNSEKLSVIDVEKSRTLSFYGLNKKIIERKSLENIVEDEYVEFYDAGDKFYITISNDDEFYYRYSLEYKPHYKTKLKLVSCSYCYESYDDE